ncbi:DUF2243 domain-containing protein [Natronorubrum daqingense]|uniref:Uncharacterized membrane protein n=1 Tax=Natronorubrum daqingense TaxID=588898 RepID=A0A1N6Y4T4_9EURY|nr:DUF2243 domain-containing protein [Natronorubrum daqingense]APX95780.1 hypothetical protein BB347_03635 [Natronorubrum daqingense]SIR09632.1 Uncharacterized membrane protein [Natronorubrum daqingense]
MSNRAETWLGLPRRFKPLVLAGVALGLGLGGFFDGLVFHQILQWHHLLSSHPDPNIAGDMELNMQADGLFHAVAWILTAIGVALLLRAWKQPGVPPSGRTLFGSWLMGWGLFNLLEGIVNHHLLGVHHVWPDGPGPVLLWDLAFLLWGLVFLAVGYRLVQTDTTTVPAPQNRAIRDDSGDTG